MALIITRVEDIQKGRMVGPANLWWHEGYEDKNGEYRLAIRDAKETLENSQTKL